jgi:hypothetical protein
VSITGISAEGGMQIRLNSTGFVIVMLFCAISCITYASGQKITLDFKGVPISNYGYFSPQGYMSFDAVPGWEYIGNQRNPVHVAQSGLNYYAQYQNGNQTAGKLFLNCADWLIENAVVRDNYSVWEYNFRSPTYNTTPPWVSGMAQGLGLNVLANAYKITGDKKYISSANLALGAFFIDVEKGGVTYKDRDGWWYEEYAQQNNKQQPRVLNGFIYCLFGIKEYYNVTKDNRAKQLYDAGLRDLKAHLPEYDGGNWTYYDKLGTISTLPYHETHVRLMNELFQSTGDPEFRIYRDRWGTYEIMVFRSVLDMFAEKIAEIENETSQVNKNIDLADQKISDIEAILNSPGPATNATESSNKSGAF